MNPGRFEIQLHSCVLRLDSVVDPDPMEAQYASPPCMERRRLHASGFNDR